MNESNNLIHQWNPLTQTFTNEFSTTSSHEQQIQQSNVVGNNTNNLVTQSSVVPGAWTPAMSVQSLAAEDESTNVLFDHIEELLCEYMRQPQHHFLHCRVLQWSPIDDQSRLFTTVIVINPPVPMD